MLEEILNFQNIKSDFLYLIPFSHKLTLNLANFRNLNVVAKEIWTINSKLVIIGATFSVRKPENSMKPVLHRKDRIRSKNGISFSKIPL